MAARVLTQVLITGTQIFGRAFVEAYRAASNNGRGLNSSANALTRQTGMDLAEAKQILNVDSLKKDVVEKQFQLLMKQNEPKDGGSFYLQSKIFRAKERIDIEPKQGQ